MGKCEIMGKGYVKYLQQKRDWKSCIRACNQHGIGLFFKFSYWSIVVCNVVLISAVQCDSVIHTDTFSFHILFHYGLSQEIGYSSLCSFLVYLYNYYLCFCLVLPFYFVKKPFNSHELKKQKFIFSKIVKALNVQLSSKWTTSVKLHKCHHLPHPRALKDKAITIIKGKPQNTNLLKKHCNRHQKLVAVLGTLYL